MRFFYDTEFIENGSTIDLISIAIVADDGRELYLHSSEYNISAASPWVCENVLPQLADVPPVPRTEIARQVRDFLLGAPDSDDLPHVELWADYGAYDHIALCQLFGTMMDLPEGMPMWTHDFQQLLEISDRSVQTLPKQEGQAHDALDDARHLYRLFHAVA